MNDLEQVLETLGIPPISQQIYKILLGNKSLSARMIAESINIPRPSVYDHIHVLQNKNLIIPKKQDGKLYFSANDPHTIQTLIDQQEQQYEIIKRKFASILPNLSKQSSAVDPKIQFFSGIEGIKTVQNDILWHKNSETYTLWPTQKVIDLVGYDYLEWHNRRRIAQNISVKVIRQGPEPDLSKYPLIKEGDETLRKVKYLIKDFGISMSYWIYADKVAFFDTSAELYGFIVHSASFSNLMKMHFSTLWDILD